jgi:hypothetical protein
VFALDKVQQDIEERWEEFFKNIEEKQKATETKQKASDASEAKDAKSKIFNTFENWIDGL